MLSFHTGPCKLCSWSWSKQILSFPLLTKSQMLDKCTPGGPGHSVLSSLPGVLPQALLSSSTEDKNSPPVSRQHLAHSVMSSIRSYWHTHAHTNLISIMAMTCASPEYRLAVASREMDHPRPSTALPRLPVQGIYMNSSSFNLGRVQFSNSRCTT